LKNLRPIQKSARIYEQVIERIIESIEQGIVRPGERLPSERELAAQLLISRSVIREAMSVLNASGIIEGRQGIGLFLVNDDKQRVLKRIKRLVMKDDVHLVQLLEARQGIEVQAAYLAAQRADESSTKEIYNALIRLEQAVNSGLIGSDEDFEFHMAIARASQNEMIVDLLHFISDRFLQTLEKTRSELMKHNKAIDYLKEHHEMYNAIANGEAQRAQELMTKHIENIKNFYKQSKGDD
jgi:GntR family transcriptional repressor for pyruvate dehydrogenase complex